MAIDTEDTITVDELDMADGASLAGDDKFLVEKTSEGVIKRVSFDGLFQQESAARTAGELLLQSQIDTLRNTFTEFLVVDAIPSVDSMRRHVLYLFNVVNDVYRGYYLIESSSGNSRGELGGRSYSGSQGITVNFETAVITNDLVTGGGTLGGNTQVDGDLTVNGDIYQSGSSYETHAEKIYTKNDMIITRDGAQSPLAVGEYTGLKAKHYDLEGNDGLLGFDKTGTARVGDYTEDKDVTVYSYDGTTFYKTKTEQTVYSSDGVTFYLDPQMTEAITPEVTPELVSGEEYVYPKLSNQVTIPTGVTPTATSEDYTYSYTADVDDTQPILTRSEESDLQDNDIFRWDGVNKKAIPIPRPTMNGQVLTYKQRTSSSDRDSFEWKSGGSGSVSRFATMAEAQDGYIPDNGIVIVDELDPYLEGEEQ